MKPKFKNAENVREGVASMQQMRKKFTFNPSIAWYRQLLEVSDAEQALKKIEKNFDYPKDKSRGSSLVEKAKKKLRSEHIRLTEQRLLKQ